jgi:hypothetical protein
MTQEALNADLRVRWAFRLYLATVAIFLLAVLTGLVIATTTSGGLTRGLTLTGAGGVLGSLTLLLRGPITRFYNDAVGEKILEHYMVSRETNEDNMRRNWKDFTPEQQELEYELWLEQRADERRAFDSLRGGNSNRTRRTRASMSAKREPRKLGTSHDVKTVESESR